MDAGQMATIAIVAALVVERILERKDRRKESALKDAADANALKDDYASELESRVERLELRLENRDKTINSMRTALKWFFDEMASSDRCKNASTGCRNRLAPGQFSDGRMAQIRELLDESNSADEDFEKAMATS